MVTTFINSSWPGGTLRACESLESIAAKLAIFNHVGPRSYEQIARECNSRALAKLLREPLSRVRAAIEPPAWALEMDRVIDRSLILSESEPHDVRRASRLKYCSRCLDDFYHSWVHNLSWMDSCFVHRRVALTVCRTEHPFSAASSLVAQLHVAWQPRFQDLLRTPQLFEGVFSRLGNRKLMGAARALGALFSPAEPDPTDARSFRCPTFALDMEKHESRTGTAETPEDGVKGPAGPRDGDGDSLGEGDGDTKRPWTIDDNEEETGRVWYATTTTRAALACGVASAIRRTTDHPLTRAHPDHKKMKFLGAVVFASYSHQPDFWSHLAHVLAAGVPSPERALLEDFIARLSHGHEACLQTLRGHYDRGDHGLGSLNGLEDSRYIASHVRGGGVCPRLLTLDLVTYMLRPHFLSRKMRLEVVEQRTSHGRVDWLHAAFGPVNIFESPEWRQYRGAYGSTMVFPRTAALADFAHHLRALEWALMRRECVGKASRHVSVALQEIASDLQQVVVSSGCTDGETRHAYFAATGASPDWEALSTRVPSHAQDTPGALAAGRDLAIQKIMDLPDLLE